LHQGKKNWRKCICSGGACIRAFGSSFHLNFSCVRLPMVTSPFASPWGVSNLWSILSRLCRVVALALGDHIFLTQVIFSWLLFSFWSFVWVFVCLFSFSFFSELVTCVCCQCAHQWGDWGPERLRTSWWSLLAVESDWQHCVTDSWPSNAGAGCGLICVGAGEERAQKVYALRRLWVERQVGFAWGTGWPAGSSTGPMVARKARWSRGQEPV
jgi:hypothetical protein